MITLGFCTKPKEHLRILCLGSHSDDIEIGCGATLLQLRDLYPSCTIQWVVFCAGGARETEAKHGSELFAGNNLDTVTIKNFRDGFLPFEGGAVKELFEEFKKSPSPDLIFTHTRADAHQDHRLINDLTWNTFRDHLILEYEIPKYDGDMGQPSIFVPLAEATCRTKAQYIMETFRSQHSKRWFQESTFLSLMRLRGMECNAPSGYAEAFYCRKVVLDSK